MRIFPGYILIWTLGLIYYAESKWIPNFFVPEEIQTILQVVYSRLPPTKIGSDSRFGVGFRLGKNADAQILVELGPQSETQALGDPGNGFSKRQSRQKPPTEYKRRNINSLDLNRNHTKNVGHKRNHNKTASEKRTIIKTSTTAENQNGTNVQRTPQPLESLGNIFTRWFRWLVQPRQDRIKSTQAKRENSINKITKENKNVENHSQISSEGKTIYQVVV